MTRFGADMFEKIRNWDEWKIWSAGLLGALRKKYREKKPGLVLIQIDGLSIHQLEEAFSDGRMPFLRSVLEREGYRKVRLFSGIPSTTLSGQAELFFGAPNTVSFNYLDSVAGEIFWSGAPRSVREIEKKLSEKSEGLLLGGSSYGSVFSAGASKSLFCSDTRGWKKIWRRKRPLRLAVILLSHLSSLAKTAFHLAVELVLAAADFAGGVLKGSGFWKEFLMILGRLYTSVILRDVITIAVRHDIASGVPVIHANLMGYDMQSHRRGPSSRYARWALGGIDSSVERIWREAHKFKKREYDVWIYSGHGQEPASPWPSHLRREIIEAVRRSLEGVASDPPVRVRFYPDTGKGAIKKIMNAVTRGRGIHMEDKFLLTATGSLSYLYLAEKIPAGLLESLARDISGFAPLVIASSGAGKAAAWSGGRKYVLPEESEKLFGGDHPFARAAGEDLAAFAGSRDTGDLILCGWKSKGTLAFPGERGSSGGPGPEETSGFALVPGKININLSGAEYARQADLRESALRLLERMPKNDTPVYSGVRRLRVMTYNIQSCIGLDRRISPGRVASIIRKNDPDIVALQEVDVLRGRTGGQDQAMIIAEKLSMYYKSHPAIHMQEEKYGNVILSKYPLKLVRSEKLPGLPDRLKLDPRSAIWAEADVGGARVNIISTHFGLTRRERVKQAHEICGPGWLGSPGLRAPVILCGDLNAPAGSAPVRLIGRRLLDAQDALEGHNPVSTWFSGFPLRRIDHIFISSDLEVTGVYAPRTRLERAASDHLPLIADLRIK